MKKILSIIAFITLSFGLHLTCLAQSQTMSDNGYKVNLFSIDRVFPVSKANVTTFREKIKELGNNVLSKSQS